MNIPFHVEIFAIVLCELTTRTFSSAFCLIIPKLLKDYLKDLMGTSKNSKFLMKYNAWEKKAYVLNKQN
jgi:thiosulfate reductase cytochrome b subunit